MPSINLAENSALLCKKMEELQFKHTLFCSSVTKRYENEHFKACGTTFV